MMYSWGLNEDSQCAIDGREEKSISLPRLVKMSINIREISAGSRHTLILSDIGQIYSVGWGEVRMHTDHGLLCNAAALSSVTGGFALVIRFCLPLFAPIAVLTPPIHTIYSLPSCYMCVTVLFKSAIGDTEWYNFPNLLRENLKKLQYLSIT